MKEFRILPHAWAYSSNESCTLRSFMPITVQAAQDLAIMRPISYRDGSYLVTIKAEVNANNNRGYLIATIMVRSYDPSLRPIMSRAYRAMVNFYLGYKAFGAETFSAEFIHF